MKSTKNVVICPPCGESVAVATKEGQNRKNALWPLLPRLTAVLPPQGREMFRGFTLIELLVVVLIVGILAAVAVSQYQKAVEKSRAVQAITLLKSVYAASQAYYLANGRWPTSFDNLDIQIPWKGKTPWYQVGHYRSPLSNQDWSIQILNGGDVNESRGVGVGRISGKYQGAAFHMFFRPRSSKIPLNQVICTEIHRGSLSYYNFGQKKGDYCQKIWGGTELPSVGDGNNYFSIF